MPKHFLIIGAGITGLAHAWALKRRYGDNVKVTVVEASDRVGGWIQTIEKNGFLFEQGPRSCRTRGAGAATLQLIEELGLQEQVIIADPAARFRYLYTRGSLQRLPSSLLEFLCSPLTRGLIPLVLKEWMIPKSTLSDESVYDFFARRLSLKAVETFVDPLISGIFAGDPQQLSMAACFPAIYQREQDYGSLTRGMLFGKRAKPIQTPFVKSVSRSPIFSLKGGMETLVNELARQLDADIRLSSPVASLQNEQGGMAVLLANGEKIFADQVVSTVSLPVLGKLIPKLAPLYHSLPYATVGVVSLGYHRPVLKQKGFGYLIPSKENEDVLGCVWDSCVFPRQNQSQEETRLTVMLGGVRRPGLSLLPDSELLSKTLIAISKHLGIDAAPDAVAIKRAQHAIPQYQIGHIANVKLLRTQAAQLFPVLALLGSSFDGPAVNDCVSHAYLELT